MAVRELLNITHEMWLSAEAEADARNALVEELVDALDNLLTFDRVERPAFRLKPEGAPGSIVRIRQEKLIALEDAAAAVLAKAKV